MRNLRTVLKAAQAELHATRLELICEATRRSVADRRIKYLCDQLARDAGQCNDKYRREGEAAARSGHGSWTNPYDPFEHADPTNRYDHWGAGYRAEERQQEARREEEEYAERMAFLRQRERERRTQNETP